MIYLRTSKNRIMPVSFDESLINELFAQNKALLTRFNGALRHPLSFYATDKSIYAVHSNKHEAAEKWLVIELKGPLDALTLESACFMADMPHDIEITPVDLSGHGIPYDSNKIVVFCNLDGVFTLCKGESHPGKALNIKAEYHTLDTSHGSWLFPRNINHILCHPADSKDKPISLSHFLFKDSPLFCPRVLAFYANQLDRNKVFYPSLDAAERALIRGEEVAVSKVFEYDQYKVFKTPSRPNELIAYSTGETAIINAEPSEWIEFEQNFTLNLFGERALLKAPVKVVLQLLGHPMHSRFDQLKFFASAPKGLAEFLTRRGLPITKAGIAALERKNGPLINKSSFLRLEIYHNTLLLHHLGDGKEIYLKVNPKPERDMLFFEEMFALSEPLESTPVKCFKAYSKLKRKESASEAITRVICKNSATQISIYASDIMPLAEIMGGECSWLLYREDVDPKSKEVFKAVLHATTETKHLFLVGTLELPAYKFSVIAHDMRSLSDIERPKSWAQTTARWYFPDVKLVLPEFKKKEQLSYMSKFLLSTGVSKVLTISSYAQIDKNAGASVDLAVRYDDAVQHYRYEFIDYDHIPNRLLKASIEAMAIRHVLLEHFSTKQTIVRGGHFLRLDVSSKMLYNLLKEDASVPEGMWPLIHYVKTRNYNGRLTHNTKAPDYTVVTSRLIDMRQDIETLQRDESIATPKGNFIITHHAVQRADQRMYREKSHGGWSFLVSKITLAFGNDEAFRQLNKRESGSAIFYVDQDNWNIALKPTGMESTYAVATIYQGFYQDQLHDETRMKDVS
ncbi:hypothetical protein ACI2KR_27035 [Pseudomonas luteola]